MLSRKKKKPTKLTFSKRNYKKLLETIGFTLQRGRVYAVQVFSRTLVKTNWEIGRHIVEFEQLGNERAEYGSDLLARLSKDLTLLYGRGFGRRNVLDMRRFYLGYKKWQTVSAKLSWSHYIALLSISSDIERSFYEKQSVIENWSLSELERQIESSLFERLALSRDKKGVLALAKKGHRTIQVQDAIREPYLLNFVKIAESLRMTEKQLEQKIIDNLQLFLLELGKGFTFVARQYKISIRNKHFHIDLVFYHRILRCFVLIDLKIKGVKHTDIGQMNLYLNYFKAEENVAGDNEPIGIILSAEKDEVLVEFAMGGISNKIFVSKYQLYLPNKKQLQARVREILDNK
jgi:predicted nuclease of restriction endonuclease-like (RecB) superfamily